MDEDPKLQDHTPLSRERILGLLSFCLNTTYFTYIHIQGSDIQTETRSSHGITNVAHNSKPIYGRIRGDCSPHSPQPHPSVWLRYVDDTFTVIHEYHVDEFTTHLNSLDSNIKFTIEPEQDGRLPFLDVSVNTNEDGSTHVIVYGKLTHTDQYLNFSSNHHLQHKSSVVRTLMSRAEVMITRPDCRREEMAHVQDALKTNGYRQWMFKVPKPNNNRALHQPGLTLMLACRACRAPPRHSHVCSKHMELALTIGTSMNTIRSILVYPKEKHLTLRNVVWYTRWSAQNARSHTSVRQAGR